MKNGEIISNLAIVQAYFQYYFRLYSNDDAISFSCEAQTMIDVVCAVGGVEAVDAFPEIVKSVVKTMTELRRDLENDKSGTEKDGTGKEEG